MAETESQGGALDGAPSTQWSAKHCWTAPARLSPSEADTLRRVHSSGGTGLSSGSVLLEPAAPERRTSDYEVFEPETSSPDGAAAGPSAADAAPLLPGSVVHDHAPGPPGGTGAGPSARRPHAAVRTR